MANSETSSVSKLTDMNQEGLLSPRDSVCLVLGGSGLLGRALLTKVDELKKQAGELDNYHFVFATSRDADLRSWEETKALFEKHKPTALIHLAAKVGGLFDNLQNNETFLRDNVLINLNVVRAATEAKVSRGIFCLSTCAYPERVPQLPLLEEYLHLGPSHPSNEGYAAAKRLLEQQVRFGRQRLQAENPGRPFVWICILPCNLYGPHDNFELKTAHVLPALIHKATIAQRDNSTLTVCGTGRALRQFLFSEDAARLLVLLLVKQDIPETHLLLNMCPDLENSEVSIKTLASIIARCSNFEGNIELDKTASDGVFRKPADNTRLREIIGREFVFTPLEEEDGAQENVSWPSNFLLCEQHCHSHSCKIIAHQMPCVLAAFDSGLTCRRSYNS